MAAKRKKEAKALAKQKNLVRGMLGNVRGVAGPGTEPLGRKKRFVLDFNRLLLKARKNVPAKQYDEYLEWLQGQLDVHLGRHPPARLAYNTFGGIIEVREAPLQTELLWVASRLSAAISELNAFVDCAQRLQRHLLRGEYKALLDGLEKFEEEYGLSLWGLELRLAVEQQATGLEAQKAFSQKVKDAAAGTKFLPFFAHWLSVRNEPTVSISGFRERVGRILNRPSATDADRAYLGFHLFHDVPRDHAALAHILRLEQGQSIFDLYESFVAVANRLLSVSFDGALATALLKSVGKLDGVVDERLCRVRMLVAGAPAICAQKALAPGFLLEGNLRAAMRAGRAAALAHGSVGAGLLPEAIALSMSSKNRALPVAFNAHSLAARIAEIISRGRSHERATSELARIGLNFSGLRVGRGLNYLQAALNASDPDLISQALEDLQINDPLSSLDGLFIPRCRIAFHQCYGGLADDKNVLAFIGFVSGATATPPALPNATSLAVTAATRRFLAEDYEQALASFSTVANEEHPAALVLFVHRFALECELRLDMLFDAIKRVSRLVSADSSLSGHLPVLRTMGSRRWKALEPMGGDMSLSIVLDAKWRQTRDDYDSTLRRFAFDEFLNRHNLSHPEQLSGCIDQFGRLETLYFLRNVCTSNVIDMLPAMESSDAVEKERRSICALLARLDPTNAEEYQAEIFEITNLLRMREGLKFLDSSRVYVDTDAIEQWADRELREEFDRYAALVEAGVGIAEDLEKVIRAVTKPADEVDAYQNIPTSEADDILVQIVEEVRRKFLFDGSHGLNSYLSRRVRHGTIVGYLRGPVEVQKLITQRESEHGSYLPNDHWTDQLNSLAPEQTRAVIRHFRRFADAYDKCLTRLRDERFHIRSFEHQEGLFDIVLRPVTFHVIRSFLQQGLTLSLLLKVCFSLFWGNLDASLTAARGLLREQTMADLTRLFDELQARLLEDAGHDPQFSALSTAIATARQAVNAEIERIADWFKKPEAEAMTNQFPLEHAVGLAVESAKAAHRTLNPKVTIDIPDEVTIVGSGVLAISEVVFTALDNAYTHSHVRGAPRLEIDARCRVEEEVVSLRIWSEIGKGVRNPKSEGKLEGIRRDIDARSLEPVAREGGTGLIKMAAAVLYGGKGDLKFRFEGDSAFIVEALVPIVFVAKR